MRSVTASSADPRLQQLFKDLSIMREKLEVLNADRGDREQAAVRRGDLQELSSLETLRGSATAAGSTPTAAEFDALVKEVRLLRETLLVIAEAVRG